MAEVVETAPARRTRRIYLGILALYFLVQIGGRLLWPGALELDEGEQLVASPWFQWGYGAQPPLYTWLVAILRRVLPNDLLALALLKNLLLFWTFAAVFLAATRLRLGARAALLASASLMLVPQIAWESQRDLTHTVLVLAVAATTLWHFAGLARAPTARGYAWLGVLLGLGTLAKYNFLVFAVALLLAGWRHLRDRRAALVLLTALLVAGPHASWLWEHRNAAAVSRFRLGLPGAALGSLAVALVTFLGPFLVVAAACFAGSLPRPARHGPVLLRRYFVIALVLLVVLAAAFGLARFADRWLQPVLFVFPMLFFAGMARRPARRATRVFLVACALSAVLIAAGLAARPVLAPRLGLVTRLGYPFDALADRIRAQGFRGGVIVGRRGFVAAALRQRFEGSIALAPRWMLPRGEAEASRRDVCIVWEGGSGESDPRQAWRRYAARLAIDLDGRPLHRCALPMRFGGGEVVFHFFVIRGSR